MRGCFQRSFYGLVAGEVLPAYAGMFLLCPAISAGLFGSPRVCGDVSLAMFAPLLSHRFSPRMRGCFSRVRLDRHRHGVLPAYAGMFLAVSTAAMSSAGSPRVCGDVSRIDCECKEK